MEAHDRSRCVLSASWVP